MQIIPVNFKKLNNLNYKFTLNDSKTWKYILKNFVSLNLGFMFHSIKNILTSSTFRRQKVSVVFWIIKFLPYVCSCDSTAWINKCERSRFVEATSIKWIFFLDSWLNLEN